MLIHWRIVLFVCMCVSVIVCSVVRVFGRSFASVCYCVLLLRGVVAFAVLLCCCIVVVLIGCVGFMLCCCVVFVFVCVRVGAVACLVACVCR